MTNNNIIDDAYNRLSNAYYFQRNRKAIEDSCIHCKQLGIPNFQERVNAEMLDIYSRCGIKVHPENISIDKLSSDVLNRYALACMNVLFGIRIQSIRTDRQYAYQILSRPVPFQYDDVLFTSNEKRFTVGDFLKVIKYSLALVDIVDPNNKVTAAATSTIWALQEIEDVLNNKSKTSLMNHSLHIAADFLASSVKESLNDTKAKRSVAVSALMVNLAIDFLVKD